MKIVYHVGRRITQQQAIVRIESGEHAAKNARDMGSIWEEKIPAGHEDLVRKYYESISK